VLDKLGCERACQPGLFLQCKDYCHYSEGHPMASINVRIDDDLKARAYRELERLGVTPSELMRQALQYGPSAASYPLSPC